MPVPPTAKSSIADLKKRLVEDGADMDSMLAETPEDENAEQESPAEEGMEPKTPAGAEVQPEVDPEVMKLLMEYGPPDRWKSDMLKSESPDMLKKCSEAFDAMSPDQQKKIVKNFEKIRSRGMRPMGGAIIVGMDNGDGE